MPSRVGIAPSGTAAAAAAAVVAAAAAAGKELLEQLALEPWLAAMGGTGLHVDIMRCRRIHFGWGGWKLEKRSIVKHMRKRKLRHLRLALFSSLFSGLPWSSVGFLLTCNCCSLGFQLSASREALSETCTPVKARLENVDFNEKRSPLYITSIILIRGKLGCRNCPKRRLENLSEQRNLFIPHKEVIRAWKS